MRKQFIIILLALLAVFGLMVSCKNEVAEAGFGQELVTVSFKEEASRGLTATLEGFDKDHLYWAYAAQKADNSQLISGQTDSYDESGAVWVRTDGNNKPVEGLGTTVSEVYQPYKVSGFSQGYWNFRLYAYKKIEGDNPATTAVETEYYVLVYQGETKNALLKSDSANAQGSHLVSVIVDPVQSEGNGSMVFLTNKAHGAKDRISMNTVNSAEYGTNYTVKVLSVQSMEEIPTEYVGTAAEKKTATDSQDGEYSLPAGSYKVTVAFTDSASNPTVNYAKGTIVATVYSNLTTTISGDLTEAMTYAEFDGILNPDLETVIASKDDIVIVNPLEIQTVILKTDTSAAKEVTATIKTTDTNSIINNMAEAAGTSTGGYDQTLELTLSVETVETTATTATYEIGMTAELTSSKTGADTVVTTSDVSEVDDYVVVEVQLETGLTQVNVLHDGKQMVEGLENPDPDKVGKFAYNGTTGVLTIKTMSFSPFEVSFVKPAETSYVAQVGKVKYQSLAAAISAAKTDGTDTITLLNDVSLLSATAINKKVVLDLAGYTIAAEAGLTASVDETTIKNGSIVGALTVSGSNIGLSAVTVTGSVDVSGSAAFDSDCSVTGTDGVAYAINVTGSIAIEGGTYAAAEGEDKYILNGNATISDGNFKGKLAPSNAENIVLTGGTYEQDESSYVPKGYECVEISAGVFKVRSTVEAVNVNTGVEYHFFKNAIDAASSGDTVKLLKNITVESEIAIAAGKTLSLDLGGKVITGTEHAKSKAVFRNAGNLTIIGTTAGSAINADATAVASIAGSTLTVNGGSYSNSYLVDNKGAYLFDVNGTATINGVTLTGIVKGIRAEGLGASVTVSDSSADVTPGNGSGWGLFGSANEGELIISSGTYRTTYSAQRQMFDIKEDGHITVNGGSFETVYSGTDDAPALVVFNAGNEPEGVGDQLTITGGTFKYAGKLGYINSSKHEVISITGGTFDASSVVVDNGETGNVLEYSITGGTFHTDPSDHLAEGYTVIENDGWYTVGTWTARIGTHGYQTILDAWTAATSVDTIVVLKDISSNSLPEVVAKKTIDLGGHTLSLAGASDGAIYIDGGANGGHGELTITNGILNMPGTNFATYGIYNYGTMTLEDIVINSACDTVIYVNGQSWGTAGSTTLDDVTINSTKASSTAFASYALKSFGTTIAPTVSIKDSEITGIYNAVMIYACPATIDGCTITATNNDALWISRAAMASGVTAKMTVSGNTTINAGSDYSRIHEQDGNSIEIITGTYNFDPTNYLAEGYEVTQSDNLYIVSKIPPEALIGDVGYTLAAALLAVETDEVIVLQKNLEVTEGYVFNKDVTAKLDLNGKKISNVSSSSITTLFEIKNGDLSIVNGSLENIVSESPDKTIYALKVVGAKAKELTDLNIKVTGTGLYLYGADVGTLDSNIEAYIDDMRGAFAKDCFDAIYLLGDSTINTISGGMYKSLITSDALEIARTGTKSHMASYPITVSSGCVINTISGGEFISVNPASGHGFEVQGSIGTISGGYFGFANVLRDQAARLFLDTPNIGSITGGTFMSGSANAVFDLKDGTNQNVVNFRNAIASGKGLVYLEDGTTTVYWSTSVKEYTNKIYKVADTN